MSGPATEPVTGPTIEEVEPLGSSTSVARPVEPGGRFGVRWIVALVVVALVAAASAAGAWYLAGSTGTSGLAGWTPSDSIVYAEARLDLPGDQRQQLGNFLAHFPGFKDQSILDDKIAEALDRSIQGMTSGAHDYATEIRPWFGGEIAVSVGPLPAVDSSAQTAPPFRGLLMASTKDHAATDAWIAKLAAASGATLTTETYKGVTIRTSGGDGTRAAVAVLDRLLVVGDFDSVKASIDTGGTAGLAANSDFKGATERLAGDHLGASYVNLRAYMEWALRAYGATSAALDPKLVDLVPGWVASDLRATNGDALTSRSVLPHVAANPIVGRGASVLAAHVPASAFAVVDAHDFGTLAKAGLDLWRSIPSMADATKAIDEGLGILGGEDAALGWIGEIAIVASPDGDGVTGGVLVAPRDASKADAIARQVRNLIALGGGSAGISSHDEDHAGTTITIVDAGDLGRFFGEGNLGAPLQGPAQRAELAFAVRDDLVAIGAPAFVRSALDASGSGTLASSTRFTNAANRVGADSPMLGWVDLTAVREMAERTLPAGADRDRYDHDVKPYLVPFDMLAFGSATAPDVDTSTFTVVTK